jgi:glycosyltransferase involved in cell wall biosynthesis
LAVVTPAFQTEIVKEFGIPREKISVVENGVETDLFSPDVDGDGVRAERGLQGKFVVSYIGTHGLAHGLATLVQAAGQLQQQHPDIAFLMVGEGADKERLVAMVKKKGLSNVHFVPQQPRDKIPSFIRASDVCVVLLKKAPVFKTVIPTKMLESMSCGRPVVLGVDGQARSVVEKAHAGVYVEPDNAKALSRAIVRLYREPQLCERLGHNGRRYIVKNLSRKHTAELYLDVLEDVCSRQ